MKCDKCGKPLDNRIVFSNTSVYPKFFPFMGKKEKMHMECYIIHVIDLYIMSDKNEMQ